MRSILSALLFFAAQATAADIYTFAVPAGVNVTTPGGATVTGWGYSLRNKSSSLWLVSLRLSAPAFQYASPEGLFDFPDIAPGGSVTVPYDFGSGTGLYQTTWDASVPRGFVNSGSFLLEAQWWSGNPLAGGRFVSQAPNASQPYSASLNPVPEPAALTLGTLSFLFLFGLAGRKLLPSCST